MEVSGSSWKSIEIKGNPWNLCGNHGTPWKSMEIYQKPWKSIGVHGNTCKSMVIYINPLESMAISCNLLKSMELTFSKSIRVHGTSVEIHAIAWMFIEVHGHRRKSIEIIDFQESMEIHGSEIQWKSLEINRSPRRFLELNRSQ